MSARRTLARWFPAPQLLYPNAAGVDISDASIKWLTLAPLHERFRVAAYGSRALQAGVVEQGFVRDTDALASVLRELKHELGASAAHAALPEEEAYVFSMNVPDGSTRPQILNMVEFEIEGRVPLSPAQAVYGFDFIQRTQGGECEIGVVAFPKDLADGYAGAFARAGIELLSLEIESRSIGRAVSDADGGDPMALLVDFGRARTGFAILKYGVPIFTSTVDVGGDHVMQVIQKELSLSEEEAERFRNEQGLIPGDEKHASATKAIEHVAAQLASEVEKHYRFWGTRRSEHGDHVTPVSRILLVGGSSNLRGLAEYIAGKVHARTERPDIWQNICSFDEYIPPIPRRVSLQYATAAGLALRGARVETL